MTRPGHWLKCGSGRKCDEPTIWLVQVSGGSCSYNTCADVGEINCTVQTRYELRHCGFTNPPDYFEWANEGGTPISGGGDGDDFIVVEHTSNVDATQELSVFAQDTVSLDSSSFAKQYTIRFTDATEDALFIGPDVNDVVFTEGQDIGTFSFRTVFGGCFADDFAVATGTLPDGLVLSSSGILTGTPTTPGTAQGLSVSMTSAGGTAVTNTFNMTVQDIDAPSVLIVRETEGVCNINPPDTTCIAVGAYQVTNANFTNPPTQFVWSISTNPGGVAIISGQGTDRVEVQSSGSANVTFTLKCIVTDLLSGDTAEDVHQYTHIHSDAALPDFWALTPDQVTNEMLGVRIGTGGLTTTHASPIYAKDYLGIYQKFPANEPVWSGGRCVLSAGPGSDVTAVYADDGVDPLAEMPYLDYVPDATNGKLYSNNVDPSNGGWSIGGTGSGIMNQVGITGAANTASLLTDADAGAMVFLNGTEAGTAVATHTTKTWVKKDTDQTRFVNIENPIVGGLFLNTQTGYVWDRAANAGKEVIDDGDWWIVLIHFTITSTTTRIGPAAASVQDASFDAAAQGSCIIGNHEVHLDKTIAEVRGLPPIFTTTAGMNTDKTVYTFDISNHDDNSAYYVEAIPSTDDIVEDIVDCGTISTSRIIGHTDLGFYATTDASGTASVAGVVPMTAAKIGVSHFLTEDKSINANGVLSAEVSAGAWAAGVNMPIGYASVASFKLRNLRRYDIASYADGKTIIDGLMA